MTGFQVGGVAVNPPVLLAPMEDVSNMAFRRITKRIAAPGLMFTEFVSAMAVHYNPERSLRKMRIHPEERPLAIQIFGGEPETMAESARHAEAMGADILDINMGCWVPKVCRTGAGAALLKDPETAERIVRACVEAVSIPVTVKVRAGWDYSLFAAPDLVRRFQGAGAQMITLHARFARQGFEGEADWSLIRELRKAVTVPLIGNGDVKSPEDALRMRDETGCDGVMVGRAAISNPWALQRIVAGVQGRGIPAEPSLGERVETALEHARLMVLAESETEDMDEARSRPDFAQIELRSLRALRGQLPIYIKGFPGASEIRERLSRVSSLAELAEILDSLTARA
ncbi:MAG: tRNA dihydrouridine synthase DusB [Fimbriimonadaceae bacterium]|nr:tRNA dihydrouridine synthase DusB [Fimbriimonadaceae bacterium]